MQYTSNTHNVRHLLSKHNIVTTAHSHIVTCVIQLEWFALLYKQSGTTQVCRWQNQSNTQFSSLTVHREWKFEQFSGKFKSLFDCHSAYGVNWKSPYWLKGTNHCVRGFSLVRSVWYTWIGVFCVWLSAVTSRSPTSVLCMLVDMKNKRKTHRNRGKNHHIQK